MKSRTLLRDRGHNVPIEAYHGNRAQCRLKQAMDVLSMGNKTLAAELADEAKEWRKLGGKPETNHR